MALITQNERIIYSSAYEHSMHGSRCRQFCVMMLCSLSGVDDQSRWWSAVLSVAVHWSALADADDTVQTDISTLERLYTVVDSVAKLSHNSE